MSESTTGARSARPLIAHSWHAIEQSRRRLSESREALAASRRLLVDDRARPDQPEPS